MNYSKISKGTKMDSWKQENGLMKTANSNLCFAKVSGKGPRLKWQDPWVALAHVSLLVYTPSIHRNQTHRYQCLHLQVIYCPWPIPCAAFFHVFAVNWFRWRIPGKRPTWPETIHRGKYWGLGTRQLYTRFNKKRADIQIQAQGHCASVERLENPLIDAHPQGDDGPV